MNSRQRRQQRRKLKPLDPIEPLTEQQVQDLVAAAKAGNHKWIPFHSVVSTMRDMLAKGWSAYHSPGFRHKYVDIRIDMRDGHCVIMSAGQSNVKNTTLEELAEQYDGHPIMCGGQPIWSVDEDIPDPFDTHRGTNLVKKT